MSPIYPAVRVSRCTPDWSPASTSRRPSPTSCAGGAAIAVAADSGTVPSTWWLDGPALESGAAVLIGTSGSTADPKGVLLTPGAIRAAAEAAHHRLGGAGNWVCPLPLHYVAGLMTAARAAAAGTTVTLVPSDLSELPLLPGRNYVSVVVAQLHRALESPDVVRALRGFDSVLVGGSAIPVGLVAARPGRRDQPDRHLRHGRDLRRVRLRRGAAGRRPGRAWRGSANLDHCRLRLRGLPARSGRDRRGAAMAAPFAPRTAGHGRPAGCRFWDGWTRW